MPRHGKSKDKAKGKGKGKGKDKAKQEGSHKKGYMQYPVIRSYYKELKKDSLENAVDILLANILPIYFNINQGYGIEQQSRPAPGITKHAADFAIRYVNNGQPRKGCLIEDKRVKFESSNTTWANALEQLTSYMTTARTYNPDQNETMYGIVTVGHYSRFYVFYGGQNELQDYSDGIALHFKKDETNIDQILRELVELTQEEEAVEEEAVAWQEQVLERLADALGWVGRKGVRFPRLSTARVRLIRVRRIKPGKAERLGLLLGS